MEDYKFICNTAIKSIQMLIEKLRSMNTTVEDSDIEMLLWMFRPECETVLRLIKIVGNRVKDSNRIARKIMLHLELESYFAMRAAAI